MMIRPVLGHLLEVIDRPGRQPRLKDTGLTGPTGRDGYVCRALTAHYRPDMIETLKWVVKRTQEGKYTKYNLMSSFGRMADDLDHVGFRAFFYRYWEDSNILHTYLKYYSSNRPDEETEIYNKLRDFKEEIMMSDLAQDMKNERVNVLEQENRKLISARDIMERHIQMMEDRDRDSWAIDYFKENNDYVKTVRKIKSNNMSIKYHKGEYKDIGSGVHDHEIEIAKRVPFWNLIKASKSGLRYLAKCPFHNEKNPSFWIYPDTNRGYCHGCGKSVDTIQFLVETRKMEFNDAVRLLLTY